MGVRLGLEAVLVGALEAAKTVNILRSLRRRRKNKKHT